jgi:small neutral amino acid transporter SnatA (MarC family)
MPLAAERAALDEAVVRARDELAVRVRSQTEALVALASPVVAGPDTLSTAATFIRTKVGTNLSQVDGFGLLDTIL